MARETKVIATAKINQRSAPGSDMRFIHLLAKFHVGHSAILGRKPVTARRFSHPEEIRNNFLRLRSMLIRSNATRRVRPGQQTESPDKSALEDPVAGFISHIRFFETTLPRP